MNETKSVQTKSMGIGSLMIKLRRKFPQGWFKPGSEFDEAHRGSIWTGEGSMINDESMFNYWAVDSPVYPMGVHCELEKLLDEAGWFAAPNDPGTYFIWPS